jgi:CheY-like chemotaxis protein
MNYNQYNWSGKTILIADDDLLARKYFAKVLETTKATLVFVKNGKEAIDYCCDHLPIDLVLMDIKMPLKDGITATKEIKENCPDIPVIIQTAYAFDYDKANAIASGSDGFITKPIHREELFQLLENILGK